MTHRLKVWFLRGVLEALERQHGASALALIAEKVPRRLLPHVSLDRLRGSAALDTILLDEGEELLLFIESLLGDGTGRVLAGVGQELAYRALGQGGVARPGDLHGTVARLQAFLDHPFVDTPTVFELKRTAPGLALTVGVVGRPRSTRVLKHLAIGAITAAERSAREGAGVTISSEVVADRAIINAHYQRSVPLRHDSELPPTSTRRPTHSSRPPSLSEEVDRILSSHRPQRWYRRISPAGGSKRSLQPAERIPLRERTSEVQRIAQRVTETTDPTSEVQPIAPRSAAVDHKLPAELKHGKG